MPSDKILQCPACKSSNDTIIIGGLKIGKKFLFCSSCSKRFFQNNKNNFFPFFIGECKSKGSPITESEDFFTNKKFKNFCTNRIFLNFRQTLEKYKPYILIDVGCGIGDYANHLKGFYRKYYGLEPFNVPADLALKASSIPDNALLLWYDASSGLPLHNDSSDAIAFIGSYDHIPNIREVMQDAYKKLKKGGRLLIMFSNYNFWPKRLINFMTAKRMFEHRNFHFSVYSPNSLIEEVKSFIDVKLEYVRADFLFLPNLPKSLKFLYFSEKLLFFVDALLKYLFKFLLVKNAGSAAIVVFKK